MRRLLTVLLAAAALALPAAPAQADTAAVPYPLAPNNAKGTLVKVQIEGSADDWGLRQFAEQMDDRWPGLKVRSYGTCAQRPTWHCVRVFTGSWDPAQQLVVSRGTTHFLGLTDYTAQGRDVYLNSFYLTAEYNVVPAAVAAHEFGHVLGLNHHEQGGITSTGSDAVALSWAEDKALRPYYGKGLGRVKR